MQSLIHQESTVRFVKVLRQIPSRRCTYLQWRAISNTQNSKVDKKKEVAIKSEKAEAPVLAVEDEENLYKERYIPITRKSIIRQLMEEEYFLNDEEKKMFESFAVGLDTAIVNKYHGVLQDIKVLFDPINPDKDTVQTRKVTRRERLDNEFWLLQKLGDILEKANFHELSEATVNKALNEHDVSEGVRIKVDREKFDVIRIWALGKEIPEVSAPWYQKLIFWKKASPPKKNEPAYYKRVVVAIRLKGNQKLLLKAFKEVPTTNLEMLIPDGQIIISTYDKNMILVTAGVALASILAKGVTVLAQLHVDWPLIITMVTGFVGVRAFAVYKNRRNAYLADLNRLLYFKNVANNRGLLALVVDRAEDESFKEALLTYTFLLSNRSPSVRLAASKTQLTAELGNLTELQLEKKIEEWVMKKSGAGIEFDSTEAIKLLKDFGILSISQDKLNVLPLDAAKRNLPQQPQSLVDRRMEEDLIEGYDRDYFLEKEDHYKEEEEKSKKYGWFHEKKYKFKGFKWID